MTLDVRSFKTGTLNTDDVNKVTIKFGVGANFQFDYSDLFTSGDVHKLVNPVIEIPCEISPRPDTFWINVEDKYGEISQAWISCDDLLEG